MTTPAIVVPDAHALPRTGVGRNAPGWWGMVLFCATEAALFAYFVVAHFYLRGASVAFSAEGGRRPELTIPAMLTIFLVSSSVALRWGEKGIERGDTRRLMVSLGVTITLGAAFLATQVVEYSREQHAPQSDAYWSAFYAITGVHGAHVAIGVLMLTLMLIRTSLGHFTATRRLAVQNVALYWHTVDGIWLIILSALYLSPYLR